MSLINNSDLIIPNTVGIISASVKEANRHLDRHREHSVRTEDSNKDIAEYIREMTQIQFILQNRINGVPLEQLVDPSRISNDNSRRLNSKEATRNYEMNQPNSRRAYEDWFRE